MNSLPLRAPMVGPDGIITGPWSKALGAVGSSLQNLVDNDPVKLVGTHAERLATDPTNLPQTLWFETDRKVFYLALNDTWVFASGVMWGSRIQAPMDLGLNDVGFFYDVADFSHLIRWDGMNWQFGPGDAGNGYYALFGVAPQEPGWQLCNGAATTYLLMGQKIVNVGGFTVPTTANTYFRR